MTRTASGHKRALKLGIVVKTVAVAASSSACAKELWILAVRTAMHLCRQVVFVVCETSNFLAKNIGDSTSGARENDLGDLKQEWLEKLEP